MVNSISTGVFQDILGAMGVPTNTISSLYKKVREKRQGDAIEILLSEIRQGNFANVDEFEAISILERYFRDALEGSAKNNLKLLAQVIKGMAENETLLAHSFLRYASILSSLSIREIKLLGIMARNGNNYTSARDPILKHFWERDLFEEDVMSILQSLLRTGLIRFTQELDAEYQDEGDDRHGSYGPSVTTNLTTNYEFTSLMQEVLEYTKFDL